MRLVIYRICYLGQLQIIKTVGALGHGDMVVTTEATESGLNGRLRVHLPMISSAVQSAWKNALGLF